MRFTQIFTAAAAFAPADSHRAGMHKPVAEVVTFRLIDGADAAKFTRAAEGMTPFLQATGAVLSRTLSVDDDGIWTDHITWTNVNAAKTSAAKIMQDPAAAPFLALIDTETIVMRHADIRLSLPPE